MKISIICFVLLLGSIAHAQPNIKGLSLYMPFNGVAVDISGNDNKVLFSNASLTSDRVGNANSAYHFNGVDQFIQIANSPSLNFTNTITLSVWVKPTGFNYDICHASQIISKGAGNYNDGTYALRFDDALYTNGSGCSGERLKDSLHMNFRGTGTTLKAYLPFVKRNTWYNVVYVNDGTWAKLYVNCVLKYKVAFKERFSNTEDLFLGKMNDSFFPFWMNGDLDDVRIYSRALDTLEIKQLCAEVPPIKKVEVKKEVQQETPEIVLEKRENKIIRTIEVLTDSLEITLYDNGTVDGDSVSLIYSDQLLQSHLLLTEKGKKITIKSPVGEENKDLVMYAENLGTIPPNTALMVIYDGRQRYELSISSSKNSNGAIRFSRKRQ